MRCKLDSFDVLVAEKVVGYQLRTSRPWRAEPSELTATPVALPTKLRRTPSSSSSSSEIDFDVALVALFDLEKIDVLGCAAVSLVASPFSPPPSLLLTLPLTLLLLPVMLASASSFLPFALFLFDDEAPLLRDARGRGCSADPDASFLSSSLDMFSRASKCCMYALGGSGREGRRERRATFSSRCSTSA